MKTRFQKFVAVSVIFVAGVIGMVINGGFER